jgi:uncharacterized protein YcfL
MLIITMLKLIQLYNLCDSNLVPSNNDSGLSIGISKKKNIGGRIKINNLSVWLEASKTKVTYKFFWYRHAAQNNVVNVEALTKESGP